LIHFYKRKGPLGLDGGWPSLEPASAGVQ